MVEEEKDKGVRGMHRSRTRMNEVRLDQLRYPHTTYVPNQFPKIRRSFVGKWARLGLVGL